MRDFDKLTKYLRDNGYDFQRKMLPKCDGECIEVYDDGKILWKVSYHSSIGQLLGYLECEGEIFNDSPVRFLTVKEVIDILEEP